ncbi:nucleotidyltransferase family protein [Tautonia sp. JC769]|uniref:nucleotidyltransferase family protein n=1 Tax=Tautonia sp. JC769 TaxID=3232135 RepID=UPI00345AD5ED
MNRQAVLDRLTSEMENIRRRFGVKDLALFGSMARNEATEQSDLDLLVTFDGRPDFDRFMDLKFHLEDLFGRPIDLVTPNALRNELRGRIEHEAIHVP